ncbi:MAG: glucoamylase family protein [Paludibacter sp.]|nr:glucoamylase family protein [Paludibacter sp.]
MKLLKKNNYINNILNSHLGVGGTLLFVIFLFFFSCKEAEIPTIIVIKNDETYSPEKVKPVIDEWQHKTFNYFYAGADPTTGMAYEGNERGTVVTTGGSGFGLMSIIVGSERGWITREEAAAQTQKIVRFLGKAERFKGMWSHWYNTDGTAHAFGDQIKTGDVVESSFMTAGLLTALEYYTADTSVETEIRDSVNSFWNTIDWKFYGAGGNTIKWLWYSQDNKFSLDIKGWNEAWIVYILALSAPEPHNVTQDVYNQGWKNNNSIYQANRSFYGYELPLGSDYGGPLFFAHYSFLGLNPQKLQDETVDYWNQNVAHTMINRHYCIKDAPSSYEYDERNWGLTACYGAKAPSWNYSARSPTNDDGVIAPTAALSSYPYTPFYSTQFLLNISTQSLLEGTYGFADAYCPSTNTSEKKHLAIDQGPIVVMIENYRSGLIWNLLMKNENIKNGLNLAGIKDVQTFDEGFYRANINTLTNEYDMMRHPDRGNYELDYSLNQGEEVQFTIKENAENKIVYQAKVIGIAGANIFSFDDDNIQNGKQHTITLKTSDNKEYNLIAKLR